MLFIAHDLSVVEYLCDDVVVMYLGRVMERGPSRELYARPRHPYTQALLVRRARCPTPRPKRTRIMLQGDIPSPIDPPSGCVFRTRCPYAIDGLRGDRAAAGSRRPATTTSPASVVTIAEADALTGIPARSDGPLANPVRHRPPVLRSASRRSASCCRRRPAPIANFVTHVREGDLLFLSGQGPREADGCLHTGKVGATSSVEDAYAHARLDGPQPDRRDAGGARRPRRGCGAS